MFLQKSFATFCPPLKPNAPGLALLILLLLTLGITSCSDDSRRRGDSDSQPIPCNTEDPQSECPDGLICIAGQCVPENTSDHDASFHDTEGADTSTNPNPDTGPQPEPDPDGTLYPLHDTTHFVQGTFERKETAFDGVFEQSADEAASLPLTERRTDDHFLGVEWNCSMRMRRINIHAPTDSPFITQNDSSPLQGKPGTVHLLGKNDGLTNHWRSVASKSFSAGDTEITFMPEDLANISPQVALAVAFDQDEAATAHIAEIEFFGYCTTEIKPFAWEASDWSCNTQCHIQGDNPGELTRSVNCNRGNGNRADNHICEAQEAKPTTIGGPCQLACPHALKFIGYRDFTYDNGSGWLHESSRRAGPLPSGVAHGQSIEDINGKPCSLLTPADEPDRYFVGISCKNPDSASEDKYCAFRCE